MSVHVKDRGAAVLYYDNNRFSFNLRLAKRDFYLPIFFLFFYHRSMDEIFMKSNESEALAKRRKHYGPESKGAICLRALCQQFSRIALSNRISVIKNVAAAQRLACDDSRVQKTVGGERLQSLAAAEHFDVS